MDQESLPISVLIFSHSRKKYLESAIKSAIDQSLDRSLYEIVVVKDFDDENIDAIIEANGIKSVLIEGDFGSIFLQSGVQNVKGEILCLLDDDDLFHHDKLKTVYEQFADKNLGYYHNSVSIINEDGEEVTDLCKPQLSKPLRINNGSKGVASKLMFYDAGFNFSSISLRKDVLLDFLDYSSKVKLVTDRLLFYSALLSGADLLLDTKKLTSYRVHRSVSVNVGKYSDFLHDRKSFLKLFAGDLITMHEMTDDPIFKRLLNTELSVIKIRLRLFDDERSYPVGMSDYLELFKWLIHGKIKYQLNLMAASLSYKFLPEYTRKAIYKRYMKEYRSAWNLFAGQKY